MLQLLMKLSCITSLSLADSRLSILSSELITSLSNLEVLDLSHNSLVALPRGIFQASKLRVLNLANNPLNHLPQSMKFMASSLEELNLRHVIHAPSITGQRD